MAAALLVRQGHEVQGITAKLWSDAEHPDTASGMPLSQRAIRSAEQVCAALGIPFHVVDLGQMFKEVVADYVFDSYVRGETPNPCVICNRHIKFGALLRIAQDLGADYMATGHYARIRQQSGQNQLLRGADLDKDQSYMLYLLGQAELATTLFPLGDYTKREVRAMAQQMNLPTASQSESQDLCFASDGDYRNLLEQHRPEAVRQGPVFDQRGELVGHHRGIALYTVGQRQGLGLTWTEPLYVLEIDPSRNALIVGPRSAAFASELIARQVHYISGHAPSNPESITAKIRYQSRDASALLIPLMAQTVRIIFDDPQFAITPGQSVVFYQDDVVLGGGVIAPARLEEA
jgi:tRNA-specific 2-thiouridylase